MSLYPCTSTDVVIIRQQKMSSRMSGRRGLGVCRRNLSWRSALLLLALLWVQPAGAESLRVTLIPSHDKPLYQDVIDGIDASIDNLPQLHLETVSLAQFRQRSAAIDANSDLLVPIGIHATDSVIRLPGRTPILATLVPRASYAASRQASTDPGREINAILLDQPVRRQLLLTRLLLGNSQRIGVPLGPGSRAIDSDLQQAAKALRLPLITTDISSPDKLMRELSHLLDRSDVLLALPDSLIFNRRTLRNILLSTYRRRIPVIGFSRAYVRAGALAAAYSTPRQIGRQTGEALLALARHSDHRLPGEAPPRYFSVDINKQVARSFGYTDLSAQRLAQQISRFERKKQ